MTRNRIFYLLFLLGCVIFSAAYRSRISAVLLIAVIIYPLLALILTAVSLLTVSAGFTENRMVYRKNEQFELPLTIRNNFIFPYAPAELDCLIPDNDTGLFLHKQVYISVAPLKCMRIFVPCMHRYRGSYMAQILKLTVYDPLKIIRLSRKTNSAMQLVILPRRIPLDELGFIFGGEQGQLPEQRRGGDKEDLSHVREYMDGDIVQLIHWKLTAKLDEMMVKQYDTTGDRRSVLLCNFEHKGITASTMIRQSDAVVEAAIAVAMSAANAGVKLLADMGAASDIISEINDSHSFERFYELMSVLPFGTPVPDTDMMQFPELIRSYSITDTSALFIITPTVDERIFAAAEDAAARVSGAVVLIYVNCSGKTELPVRDENSRFIFAETAAESDSSLSAASEQILSEFLRIN